ncbi:hypothetical protein ITI46_21845 [Streptomyces oryzae]|uniref:Secreted protein n=1 Tax=Streptomyces oryzae TaxID=1434886 RepID=A0ABS3XFW7_9ACTN|nr:hypothetical protein [Streptomyces oryzae]MBO8194282.1 hypothetical protein [Streptomyces oryzae]
MDVAVVIGLVFVLAVLIFGTIITLRVVRAVKRGVERTGAQVRRTAEETMLKARSAQPGPIGEAARIRLKLRTSIDSTRAALEAGARNDPSLSEAADLLDKLHEHARHLDGELRMLMEREPDQSRVAARLPEARERMQRIKESADSLRFAAQDRARQFDAEGLSALRDRIDIESGALRHWTRDPAGPGPVSSGQADHGSPADAEAAAESSAGAASSASTQSPASAEQTARPELGPSGQGLDPSLTDPTADRRDSMPTFEKRRPRSAS